MLGRKIFKYLLLSIALISLTLGGLSQAQNGAAMPANPTDETKVPHYFGPYPNWANSPYTLPDVAVEILGDGAGAAATATVGGNGAITGVTITSPGSGYTAATVNFLTTNGTGAMANAVVSTSGSVTAINVLTAGSGYTAPTVSIGGGGVPYVPASATAAVPTVYNLTVGSATGGSFTLTVDSLATTAPIAWNALAGDVQLALSLVGINTTVTGSGSIADPWVITFATAPVSVVLDGSGLTQFAAVTDAALTAVLNAYNLSAGSATGGTFTLSVDGLTTAAIAFNATASDVQNALTSAGITATVRGTGPWVVSFATAPVSVSIDPAGLTQGVVDASATPGGSLIVYNVTVGSATGGTFTLAVDGGIPTAPIAWNALAGDVQSALALVGITTTVTGSGSVADPYVIVFAAAPTTVSIDAAGLIQGVADAGVATTADPLIFNATVGSATGGSFTLTVDGLTTASLAWNAPAGDVQTALANAGISVTSVTGSGSTLDPWVITFVAAPASVTMDTASLTQPVLDASAVQGTSIVLVYNVTIGSATGGTFLLVVDSVSTSPIAWNAGALDVQGALSLAGFTATVTGSGSSVDPWVITFASAPTTVSIDPAGLTRGVADASVASAAAGTIFDLSVGSASGGTFTLTFDGLTTAAIAFNATASDIQNALSLAGVTASVSGTGPWVITFAVAPITFALDATALTMTIPVSDSSLVAVVNTYDVTLGSATGGTFSLVVDAVPTAPIAFNATALDIENALFAAGFTATVSGTGPWSIVFAAAPASVTIDGTLLTQPAFTGATATAYGGVNQIVLDFAGSGYIRPTVDIDAPNDPNGVQATAFPVCADPYPLCEATTPGDTVTILGITVQNPGSGYSTAPAVVIRDGTLFDPTPGGGTGAIAHSDLFISSIVLDTFGSGYTSAPTVDIIDPNGTGATASAEINYGAVVAINLTAGGSGYLTQGGIKKFQDGLPVLCDPLAGWANCTDNNLGQHIPIAVPDTTTFPGTDYYVIAVVQHRERMSSSLPVQGTLVREYVQLETSFNADFSKHVALQTSLLDGTTVPTMMPDGITPAIAVDDPHFLGPIIVASKDRAVRIVFYNLLPDGEAGDLFLPVDTTMMGSGMGPTGAADPVDEGTVMDEVRNPMCTEKYYDPMMRDMCFTENRATLHLHGGITPWISDGTPHQWITPANEMTPWPEGVAVEAVPDMTGVPGVPDCTADNDGCMTFYYTNQQSARLMFYHDHAWGITRLNVYAGEAAGYVITDQTEAALLAPGGAMDGLGVGIPLVIQDRTFVPDTAQLAAMDPTWDVARWGGYGNFWYHHVYMPAQNPGDPGGMSAYGRWMYGPWFWPPATPMHGPILNPYYNMDPATGFTTPLAVPCSLDNPATWQYQTDPFCEPQYIPGTPNISVGMEQFNDTPIVNGTAYPTLTLDPKSYRLRILNAANDRFWNLQWYIADPSTGTNSEVALDPALVAAAQLDPVVFPTPLETLVWNGQTYDLRGPDWIQIGSEGGFLPKPVVIDGQQETTWITDPTRFDVGNVDLHSLVLAPAERADVIVDFSQFAGKTLILYNDAPAAYPARVPSYDYYTGYPDQSPNGPSAILPGYGPNTRTIMQVTISATPPAPAFNLAALNSAFAHKANGTGVFESGQHPIIVGQAAYNSAYGTNFAASSWCNSSVPTNRCDGFARISDQGGDSFGFNTLLSQNIRVSIPLQPKALHDEMNAVAFDEFGRMTANIGLEAVPANPGGQNVTLYPYINPSTELIDATGLPTADVKVMPISNMADGTQIWKITHNGVDTHPIHFHLYDVQVLNRVTWDNIIIPPEGSELGWKDTVRISPLEDTIVALRPIIPYVPFELKNSIRNLNPMMPTGSTAMFNNMDANGNPTAPIVNQLVNFGWEYVWHCHILSHEEMDMMRPVSVALPPNAPDGLTWTVERIGPNNILTLTWNDNSINETSFVVQKSTDGGATWIDVGTSLSPLDVDNTHGTRTLADATFDWGTTPLYYRVVALNTIGYGGEFMSLSAKSYSAYTAVIAAPTNLTAAVEVGPSVNLAWMDNARNETGFTVERSADGGITFTTIASVGPRNNTGLVTYKDSTVVLGVTYTYRVAALVGLDVSPYSNLVDILVDVPATPVGLVGTAVRFGNNERVTLTWTDASNNETGFTIQRDTDPAFPNPVSVNVGANVTTYTTGNIPRVVYYFRILAFNALGQSGWNLAAPIAPAPLALAVQQNRP